MLERVDRMLLAVRDRAAAEQTFRDLLGAEKLREDTSDIYNAKRTVVQVGISEFELLEPRGDSPVQSFIDRWGEGLFAAGMSTNDVNDIATRLSKNNVAYREEGGQLHIAEDQTPGMNVVISSAQERSPVGAIKWLYEMTNVVDDHESAARFYTDAFGLDPSRFSPIKSRDYGYVGQLTLFDPPDRLDRIELSQTTDPSRAMGRFHTKRGQSIYMCYVETDDVAGIIERCEKRGARYARRPDEHNPEGLFIHPSALHGTLMGVSRTQLAWLWSGRPELSGAASRAGGH